MSRAPRPSPPLMEPGVGSGERNGRSRRSQTPLQRGRKEGGRPVLLPLLPQRHPGPQKPEQDAPPHRPCGVGMTGNMATTSPNHDKTRTIADISATELAFAIIAEKLTGLRPIRCRKFDSNPRPLTPECDSASRFPAKTSETRIRRSSRLNFINARIPASLSTTRVLFYCFIQVSAAPAAFDPLFP